MKVERLSAPMVDIKDVPAGALFEHCGKVFVRTTLSVNTSHRQEITTVAVNLESGETLAVMYCGGYVPVMVRSLKGKVVIE